MLSRLFSGVDGSVNQLLGELSNGIGALTELMNAYNAIFSSGDLNQLMQLIQATLGGGQLDFLQQ